MNCFILSYSRKVRFYSRECNSPEWDCTWIMSRRIKEQVPRREPSRPLSLPHRAYIGKSLVQKNRRSTWFQEPIFVTVRRLLRIHQRFIRTIEGRLPIQ